METTYVRCKECGFVYDMALEQCPNCGSENNNISEEFVNEAVFNILD